MSRSVLTLLGLLVINCSQPPPIPKPEAQAPRAFDLVCAGETVRFDVHGSAEAKGPARDRIRIDLDRRIWCREACSRLFNIRDAAPGFLHINAFGENGDGTDLRVNRVTGELREVTKLGTYDAITTANCTLAPFSGMPSPKF